MVCETRMRANQTAEQRKVEIREALGRLEAQLKAGTARLVVGPQGSAALVGWNDRDDVTDVCAIRALQSQRSFELQRALATAEASAGRKLDQRALNSGLHSHDGGKTWHAGH